MGLQGPEIETLIQMKDQNIQKFLEGSKAFQAGQVSKQEMVDLITRFNHQAVSLTSSQKAILTNEFQAKTSFYPLYIQHFSIFLQFYLTFLQLPPLADKQPKQLIDLFKAGSAESQFQDLLMIGSQVPNLSQLYIGLKIADTYTELKKQNIVKDQWYLLILQIAQRNVKHAIEKAVNSQPHQHIVKGVVQVMKRALNAARSDPKEKGIHRPGATSSSINSMLRHFQFLFAFDITEGIMNLKLNKVIHQSCYSSLFTFIYHYLKDSYSIQEIFQNYAVQRNHQDQGYSLRVSYNPAGAAYFLNKWIKTETAKFGLSPSYRLKLIMPSLYFLLKNRGQYTQVSKSLLQIYLEQANALSQEIKNINHFSFPLDLFIEKAFSAVVEDKPLREKLKSSTLKLLNLAQIKTRLKLIQRLFRLSGNSTLNSLLIKYIDQQKQLFGKDNVIKLLKTHLSRSSIIAAVDRLKELQDLFSLLQSLKETSLEKQIRELVKLIQDDCDSSNAKINSLKAQKERDESELERALVRLQTLKDIRSKYQTLK